MYIYNVNFHQQMPTFICTIYCRFLCGTTYLISTPADAEAFVRVTFGWGRDIQTVVRAAQGFRSGWIVNAPERKVTRALTLDIIRDSVSASDCLRHIHSLTT
jgi:hypothetical protein